MAVAAMPMPEPLGYEYPSMRPLYSVPKKNGTLVRIRGAYATSTFTLKPGWDKDAEVRYTKAARTT